MSEQAITPSLLSSAYLQGKQKLFPGVRMGFSTEFAEMIQTNGQLWTYAVTDFTNLHFKELRGEPQRLEFPKRPQELRSFVKDGAPYLLFRNFGQLSVIDLTDPANCQYKDLFEDTSILGADICFDKGEWQAAVLTEAGLSLFTWEQLTNNEAYPAPTPIDCPSLNCEGDHRIYTYQLDDGQNRWLITTRKGPPVVVGADGSYEEKKWPGNYGWIESCLIVPTAGGAKVIVQHKGADVLETVATQIDLATWTVEKTLYHGGIAHPTLRASPVCKPPLVTWSGQKGWLQMWDPAAREAQGVQFEGKIPMQLAVADGIPRLLGRAEGELFMGPLDLPSNAAETGARKLWNFGFRHKETIALIVIALAVALARHRILWKRKSVKL